MTPTITLGGQSLNERFTITSLRRPFPEARNELVDVSGRAGSVLASRTLGTRTVSFRLWATSHDHETLMATYSWLATLLHSARVLTLTISDEGGRVRRVVPEGLLDYDEYVELGSMELTLLQLDPFCTLPPYSVSVPSGGSVSFTLEHANPDITITATQATRDASTQLWGLRFDGGDYARVKLATSSGTPVTIDCSSARHVTVAGEVAMLTPDSDWPRLAAGAHTVAMDKGTGAATLTITERLL